MALKLGTENKRNVIIAAVLFCVLAYLAISQLTGGPPTPAPVKTVPRVATQQTPVAARPATAGNTGNAFGPEAKKVTAAGVGSGLDPALHLERLAASESLDYAGSGRNIFSGESAPVAMEVAAGPARPQPMQPTGPAPYVAPTPPAIDLRYFGYSATKDGKREAFLLHGDDIFEAAAGEIVNHRYKVVSVDIHSVQLTDLSYNNTQTLPLAN